MLRFVQMVRTTCIDDGPTHAKRPQGVWPPVRGQGMLSILLIRLVLSQAHQPLDSSWQPPNTYIDG